MASLKDYRNQIIEWDMTPEDAVVLYLEWGNNNFLHEKGYVPVRGKEDHSIYFVVNTWGPTPKVYLMRRNSDEAVELAALDLPQPLGEEFLKSVSNKKGVFALNESIKKWLQSEMHN